MPSFGGYIQSHPTYHQNQQNSTSRPQFFAQRSHGRLQVIFDGRKNGKRDRSHVFTRGCGIFSNRFLSTWSRCWWKSLGTSSKLCTWIIRIFAILCALDFVGLRSGRIDVPGISLFFCWNQIWCFFGGGNGFQFLFWDGKCFLYKDLFKNCRCLEFPGDQVGDRDLFSVRFWRQTLANKTTETDWVELCGWYYIPFF